MPQQVSTHSGGCTRLVWDRGFLLSHRAAQKRMYMDDMHVREGELWQRDPRKEREGRERGRETETRETQRKREGEIERGRGRGRGRDTETQRQR